MTTSNLARLLAIFVVFAGIASAKASCFEKTGVKLVNDRIGKVTQVISNETRDGRLFVWIYRIEGDVHTFWSELPNGRI